MTRKPQILEEQKLFGILMKLQKVAELKEDI